MSDENKAIALENTGDQDKTTDHVPARKDAPDDVDGADKDKPVVYRPEGLPDHLLGENDQETINRLFKAVDGYRKEQAKSKNIPEKLDDYKIDLPEDVSNALIRPGKDGKDAYYEAYRSVLYENNIAPSVGEKILVKMFEMLEQNAESANDPEALDNNVDFDFKEFGGKDKAMPLIDGVEVWANGLLQQNKLTEKQREEMRLWMTSSEGLSLILAMRELSGADPIPAKMEGGAGNSDEITKDKLDARIKDPRYWRDKDKVFIEETTRMFQELYNNEAA